MSKWIIRDWAGNDCNLMGRAEFKSYGDARDEISWFANSIVATAVKNGKYKADSVEADDAYNGICEDLYAINIDDNGNELPDEGQYTI